MGKGYSTIMTPRLQSNLLKGRKEKHSPLASELVYELVTNSYKNNLMVAFGSKALN
jgi:hypothetical protein